MRLAVFARFLPFYAVAVHLHLRHSFHGAPIGYVGLAAAAAASWIGLPGPGEPVLIAAGVFAAKNKLDIGGVVFTAWAAATLGGIAGWLIGLKAGRAVLVAPGPLERMRRAAIKRGDDVFTRVPVIAIILTPSWIAGIHRVNTGLYLTVNALSAAAWAAGIGLGAYFVGPSVIDAVGDLGWVTGIGLVLLVLAGVTGGVIRHRRRSRTRELGAGG